MAIVTDSLVIYQHYSNFDDTADDVWANLSPTPAYQIDVPYWSNLSYNSSGVRYTSESLYNASHELYNNFASSATLEFGFQFSTLPKSEWANATLFESDNAEITFRSDGNTIFVNWHGRVASATFTPVRNTYYHLAVRIGGNNVQIWLDGVQLASQTTFTGMSTLDNQYYLAAGNSGYLVGYLKYFRFYVTPLMESDLQQNYANGVSLGLGDEPEPEPDPIAYTRALSDSVRIAESFQKVTGFSQRITLAEIVRIADPALSFKKGTRTLKSLTEKIRVTEPLWSRIFDNARPISYGFANSIGTSKSVVFSNGILVFTVSNVFSGSVGFLQSRNRGVDFGSRNDDYGSVSKGNSVTTGLPYQGLHVFYHASVGKNYLIIMSQDTSGLYGGELLRVGDLVIPNQGDASGVSIAYDAATNTLHLVWTAALTSNLYSHELYYQTGVIGSNKTVTWGARTKLSNYANSNQTLIHGFRNPKMILRNGKPYIFVSLFNYQSSEYSLALVTTAFTSKAYPSNILNTGLAWGNKPVNAVAAYENSAYPNVIDLPTGLFAVAWHGGLNGANPTTDYIYFSKSVDAVTWSTPVSLVPGKLPSLSATKDGRLLLAYENAGVIYYIDSIDNGTTWSQPVLVLTGTNPAAVYDTSVDYRVPFLLYDGTTSAAATGIEGGPVAKQTYINLLEQFLVEDTKLVRRSGKVFKDTLTTGETFTKKGTNNKYESVNDSVMITDSLTKRYSASRVLTDRVNSAETLKKAAARSLSESLQVTDGTLALLKGNMVTLYETLRITDTTKKSVSKIQRDTMTVTENESGKTSKQLSKEILSITDAQLQLMLGTGVRLADFINSTDTLKKAMVKVLRDSVSSTDSIKNKAITRQLRETITILDTLSKKLAATKTLKDNVTVADKALTYKKYQAVRLYDAVFVRDILTSYLPNEYREMVEYTVRVHSEIMRHLSTVKTSKTATTQIVTGKNFTTKA